MCVLCFSFQNEADRTLIYVTLYISECLKRLQKVNCIFVNAQSLQWWMSALHDDFVQSLIRETTI